MDVRARLLAHRGLWGADVPPNSVAALTSALEQGFGIETDVRDRDGRVVVSHDPPDADAPDWAALVERWSSEGLLDGRVIAVNVKSDGLLPAMESARATLRGTASFYFDMSFPQTLAYARAGEPVALRVSEYEPLRGSLVDALGIAPCFWLDAFASDWWLASPWRAEIDEACATGRVAFVSPEIHGRDPRPAWAWFATTIAAGGDVLACTDRPADLLEYLS